METVSELEQLRIEINVKLYEIQGLIRDIGNLDKIIMDEDDSYPEAREHIEDVIDEYKKAVDKTKILMECFFHEEQKAGKPTDFLFRRLYRKLHDAY